MALIKCSECGKEISDKAAACPNCGCPVEQQAEQSVSDVSKHNLREDSPLENTNKEESSTEEAIEKTVISEESEAKTEEEAPVKKAISKKTKIIIGAVAAVVVVAVVLAVVLTKDMRAYNKATGLMEAQSCSEAVKLYSEIEGYKDSADKIAECKYYIAAGLMEDKSYEDAAKIFNEISSYSDAETRYKECQYQIAKLLYGKEQFADAAEIYKSIGEYQDASKLLKDCEYQQTVDGQFMRALTKGLIGRWDYSDEGYKADNDKEFDKMNSAEYTEYIRKCIGFEQDNVKSFADKTFTNEQFEKDAKDYINIIDKSLKAVEYYTMDYTKYNTMWNDLYARRSVLIRKFVNEYNLKVDEEHQKTLDSFIKDAGVVDEQKALEQAINEMVANFTYEVTDKGYGSIYYVINMENTTEVTFEYFGCAVDLLDENGTIVYTGYTGEIKNFVPGQKAQLEVYTGLQGSSLQFHPNYFVAQ
ncbi:zinc ribbon domain-containing protein [Ruminococcus sp. OA3]|uniref:zinc ribbon domain-containing protein n=1 Tax=Ruminococcus sp. OA3 TaxID=2914164 RepID=UPI001F06E031|nr:zinc ribbon domain-containing protein [Ruminococcus sp. OA3]MCH1982714.1 zinc ribbon domain-containing protein [Ruminococcus sp. OA3]